MILIAVFVGVVAVVVRKTQSKSNLAKTTFRKLSLQVHQANFGSSLTHSLSKSVLLSPKLLSSWYRQSRKSLRTRLSPLTTHVHELFSLNFVVRDSPPPSSSDDTSLVDVSTGLSAVLIDSLSSSLVPLSSPCTLSNRPQPSTLNSSTCRALLLAQVLTLTATASHSSSNSSRASTLSIALSLKPM